jgi:excisionase family DNA binding protein
MARRADVPKVVGNRPPPDNDADNLCRDDLPVRKTSRDRRRIRVTATGGISMDKLLLTIDEAAHALGIGRSKLYQLLDAGEVDSVHIGNCRRVTGAALSGYVERLQTRSGSSHR